MKKLGIMFIALVVLILGALVIVHSNLDYIIKAAIEKYGSQAAQVAVRLDSVKLSLTSGEGELHGLTVANPQGFSSAKVLSLGMISVKLDTSSVTGSGPIIIREITIDKPDVNVEASNSGDTNLQTLEKNLSAGSHAASSNGNAPAQEPGRKIIISQLYIRDGHIDITHPLLKKALTAPLPTIHLTNIGKDSGGATPAQIADKILASIASSANQIASNDLAKNLSGAVKDAVGSKAGDIGNRLGGLLGQ